MSANKVIINGVIGWEVTDEEMPGLIHWFNDNATKVLNYQEIQDDSSPETDDISPEFEQMTEHELEQVINDATINLQEEELDHDEDAPAQNIASVINFKAEDGTLHIHSSDVIIHGDLHVKGRVYSDVDFIRTDDPNEER